MANLHCNKKCIYETSVKCVNKPNVSNISLKQLFSC